MLWSSSPTYSTAKMSNAHWVMQPSCVHMLGYKMAIEICVYSHTEQLLNI